MIWIFVGADKIVWEAAATLRCDDLSISKCSKPFIPIDHLFDIIHLFDALSPLPESRMNISCGWLLSLVYLWFSASRVSVVSDGKLNDCAVYSIVVVSRTQITVPVGTGTTFTTTADSETPFLRLYAIL